MTAPKFLIIVAFVILLLLSHRLWLADDGYLEVTRLEQDIQELRKDIAAKEERNRKLNAEVRDLKDGVDAVEERARSELGMTGKDETFVQIIEDTESSDKPTPQ